MEAVCFDGTEDQAPINNSILTYFSGNLCKTAEKARTYFQSPLFNIQQK